MIRTNPEAAIAMGRTMTEILYDHMDKGLREIDNPTFGLTWSLGEHRLGDGCKSQVLTIKHFEMRRANTKRQVLHWIWHNLKHDDPPFPLRVDYVYAFAPEKDMRKILTAVEYQPTEGDDRTDMWVKVPR